MNTVGEQYLRETILPDLDNGRSGWDRPHTELVVIYAKDIIAASNLELDEEVIVPAAYGHDWGYTGLFSSDRPSIAEVKARKPEHMRRGAQKMAGLLEHPVFDYLSAGHKARIGHLILMHDMVEFLSDPDELVLMEADTLAFFDDRVLSTHTIEAQKKVREKAMKRRVSRFMTGYSIQKIRELTAPEPA